MYTLFVCVTFWLYFSLFLLYFVFGYSNQERIVNTFKDFCNQPIAIRVYKYTTNIKTFFVLTNIVGLRHIPYLVHNQHLIMIRVPLQGSFYTSLLVLIHLRLTFETLPHLSSSHSLAVTEKHLGCKNTEEHNMARLGVLYFFLL